MIIIKKSNHDLNGDDIFNNVVMKCLAVKATTGKVTNCKFISCDECAFDKCDSCEQARQKWLRTIPTRNFTEPEKEFVKVTKLNWFARNNDNILYGFIEKPRYDEIFGEWKSTNINVKISDISDCNFSAISCADIEPTSREEILGS